MVPAQRHRDEVKLCERARDDLFDIRILFVVNGCAVQRLKADCSPLPMGHNTTGSQVKLTTTSGLLQQGTQ